LNFLPWVIFAILTALTGISLVQYLVSSPKKMRLLLLLLTVLLIGSIVWAAIFFNPQQTFTVIILALVCFLAGYLGATTRFLNRHENRILPAITRAQGESGTGHTAIIYFTHGEPPAYDPAPWIETMHEFDHDHVPFIPFPFAPSFSMQCGRNISVPGVAHIM